MRVNGYVLRITAAYRFVEQIEERALAWIEPGRKKLLAMVGAAESDPRRRNVAEEGRLHAVVEPVGDNTVGLRGVAHSRMCRDERRPCCERAEFFAQIRCARNGLRRQTAGRDRGQVHGQRVAFAAGLVTLVKWTAKQRQLCQEVFKTIPF